MVPKIAKTRPRKRERPRTQPEINIFRRQALIEATIQSIHEHGLCATTVDTICRAAGVSRGLIRHYFAGKDDLMVATYRQLRDEIAAEIRRRTALAEGDARRQLHAMMRSMFELPAFETPKMAAWLGFSIASQSSDALRAVNRETYEAYRADAARYFARASAEKRHRLNAERAATGLIALTDGLWLEYLLDSGAFAREEAIAICIEYIDRALGA